MTTCCWCNKPIKLGWWRFWVRGLECPHCRRPVVLSKVWVTRKPDHADGRKGCI